MLTQLGRCRARCAAQGGDGGGPYLKASATCKHFIGNDLEGWQGVTRHNFDANISAADMRDTFMPPFEACVQRARAGSVMCSYNRRALGVGVGVGTVARGCSACLRPASLQAALAAPAVKAGRSGGRGSGARPLRCAGCL